MGVATAAVIRAEPAVRTIVGASARGASHLRSGHPCQDAFRALEHDGSFAIAVADGLGSAARSDLGSQVAVLAASSRAVLFADDDPAEAALDGIAAARGALEALARGDAMRLPDLACTLIVAAGNADGIAVAHIGDGAAVGRRADEWLVLSPPGPSEYLNETDPLTARDWDDRVRCVCALDGVDGLALFTDGCQHAALRRGPTAYSARTTASCVRCSTSPAAAWRRPMPDGARRSARRTQARRALGRRQDARPRGPVTLLRRARPVDRPRRCRTPRGRGIRPPDPNGDDGRVAKIYHPGRIEQRPPHEAARDARAAAERCEKCHAAPLDRVGRRPDLLRPFSAGPARLHDAVRRHGRVPAGARLLRRVRPDADLRRRLHVAAPAVRRAQPLVRGRRRARGRAPRRRPARDEPARRAERARDADRLRLVPDPRPPVAARVSDTRRDGRLPAARAARRSTSARSTRIATTPTCSRWPSWCSASSCSASTRSRRGGRASPTHRRPRRRSGAASSRSPDDRRGPSRRSTRRRGASCRRACSGCSSGRSSTDTARRTHVRPRTTGSRPSRTRGSA